jgi:hypothetical protein
LSAITRPGRAQTGPGEQSGKFDGELLARTGKTRPNEQSGKFDGELLARTGKTRPNEHSGKFDGELLAPAASPTGTTRRNDQSRSSGHLSAERPFWDSVRGPQYATAGRCSSLKTTSYGDFCAITHRIRRRL